MHGKGEEPDHVPSPAFASMDSLLADSEIDSSRPKQGHGIQSLCSGRLLPSCGNFGNRSPGVATCIKYLYVRTGNGAYTRLRQNPMTECTLMA